MWGLGRLKTQKENKGQAPKKKKKKRLFLVLLLLNYFTVPLESDSCFLSLRVFLLSNWWGLVLGSLPWFNHTVSKNSKKSVIDSRRGIDAIV